MPAGCHAATTPHRRRASPHTGNHTTRRHTAAPPDGKGPGTCPPAAPAPPDGNTSPLSADTETTQQASPTAHSAEPHSTGPDQANPTASKSTTSHHMPKAAQTPSKTPDASAENATKPPAAASEQQPHTKHHHHNHQPQPPSTHSQTGDRGTPPPAKSEHPRCIAKSPRVLLGASRRYVGAVGQRSKGRGSKPSLRARNRAL